MQKVRRYIQNLLWSMSDPAYYYALLHRKIIFSIFFFLLTIALATCITVTGWRVFVWPDFIHTLQTESVKLVEQIPADAIFSYNKGTLTVQKLNLPFAIKSTDAMEKMGMAQNFLKISSEEKASDSTITFTPTTLYVSFLSDGPESMKYADLTDADSFSANRDQVKGWLSSQIEWLTRSTTVLTVAFFTANFIGSLIIGLVLICLFALIVQSIAWLLGLRLLYRQTFQWGLHLYPVALLIDQLSLLIAPKSHFPLVNITFLLMSAVILWYGYRHRRPVLNA